MTLRDRLVLIGVVVVAIIGAAWLLVVSPERSKAGELGTQLSAAKAQLSTAEGQLANARRAQARYAASYSSIVSLGKAVPTSQEVPSLIYELARASQQKDVNFASITTAASTTSGTAASSPSTAGASGGSTVAAAGFSALPFTFVFNGSYEGLEHMLRGLDDLTTRTPAGKLDVSGRLLTIQSVKLSPVTETGKSKSVLSASVTASAYELPPESTSATAPSTSPATAGSSAAPSSTTAPAIVRVKP
jgi:Tfp pilus assembly protein PilO